MNREIKFRVWNEKLEEMYKIKKANYLGSTGIIDTYIGGDNAVWMQYTGLKDKNGVEIYDGDVIASQNKDRDNWYVSHHEIVWYDTGFMGKQICSGSYIGLNYWTSGLDGYVVIGNIYSNPGLLEVSK